jgi:amino acid adenylation domain-containing protein
MPRARIDAILENLCPRAIIADRKNYAAAVSLGLEHTFLYDDICKHPTNREALALIRKKQCDTDAIYVVFTSGSTGTPKGVVACHRSVIDYTESLTAALEFDENTVFANQTPLYFDAPLKELMPTLKMGATTYFVPRMLFSFPVKLVEYLDTYKINTVCWVVSALTQISSLGALESHTPKYLTTVAFGSEVFPRKQYDLWRAALPHARFFNLYGPTEATGMSCYWRANRELLEDEPIPVGQPFDNTDIILLDSENRKAAEGQEGEICIRGTCVTMGYYNNPERTDEAFVQNPLQKAYREIIYRTGDIGRYNEHGELVFVCRKDNQIKHMGHRIELGEIESVAMKLDGVARAVCVYNKDKKEIGLFFVGERGESELYSYLTSAIPRYMIPAFCAKLSAIPLTDNGKINRRELLKMAQDR